MRVLFLLPILLAGCVTSPGGTARGPSAFEAMQRLPPVVGTFARVPVTAAVGSNDDARQVAGTAYQQIAGTALVTVVVPNAPDPAAAEGFGGAGMARAMEGAILRARLRAAREGATLTVRDQLTASRDGQPILRCWVTEVAGRGAAQLRTECLGLVVDRFINLAGSMPDSPTEMGAVLGLGMQLVQVLRDPNSPPVTQLRALPAPQVAPTPEAVPAPPGMRRGRAYSL